MNPKGLVLTGHRDPCEATPVRLKKKAKNKIYYSREKKLETTGDRGRIAQLSKYRNNLHQKVMLKKMKRAD